MKKGFTLIELLAVIVILAVIAVIAVPIVLNIINDSKESAVLRSADFYLRGLETSIATSVLNNVQVPDGKYSIMEDGNICIGTLSNNTCTGDILKVEMYGEVPTEGTIKINNGQIQKIDITLSDKKIWTNLFTGKLEYKLEPGLYDTNNKLLMSWNELIEEYDFKNLVEIGGYNDDYSKSSAANVIDSIEGASKLVLDSSVTKIGEEAFMFCEQLESIIIPNSVTSIGSNSFAFNYGLTSIEIPDSVISIGSAAFEECSNLTTLIIGSGLRNIDIGVFYFCNKLTTVIIDSDNPIYDSRDNSNAIIETATNTLIVGCVGTTIPNSVTSIGRNAFERIVLTSIIIPDSITSIDDYAFSETDLKSITIPSSVRYIGIEAFIYSSLIEVTILSSEVNIEDNAFVYCDSLTTIYYKGNTEGATWIPEGVTVKTIS